jgi:protein O-mannosyl-transferase
MGLLTLLVYLPALRNDFVYWDDNLYIFENPYIRSLNAAFFRWAFLDFHASNWHPLTWISHAVDYALWGLNPLGHHLTSIILHAINTALVVLLALRLLGIARVRSTANTPTPFLNDRTVLITACVTGLLFGIHPVHVESVAWVAERKDLLCGLFFLLSIMMYMNYVSRQTSTRIKQKTEGSAQDEAGQSNRFMNKHYLLTLGFFALALLSKPMAVTLPLVLLILDWYPLERIRSYSSLWAATIEKLPFFALSVSSSLITIVAQQAGNSTVSLEFVPLSSRLLVAVQSLVGYLEKMLWPLNLVPLYPYPRYVSLSSFEYILAIGLVLGITIVCAIFAIKQRLWLSAWGYYVVTLVPVLGLIQVGNQSMADRYTYLPSIGPFLVVGLCSAWISDEVIKKEKTAISAKLLSISISLILVFSLSYLTVEQIGIWRSSLSLWTCVIEREPDRFPLAYNNRGMVFYHSGDFNKAIADFDKAVALDPQYAKAYYNRGSVFYKTGELEKSIIDFRKTISLDPLYYEAYYYLDQVLKKRESLMSKEKSVNTNRHE